MDGYDVQYDDADDVSGDRHGSSTGQQPVLQGSEEKGKTPRSLPGTISLARAATSIFFFLSRQTHVCRDKRMLTAKKNFCRDKTKFACILLS